jgi:hypothetical protein
VYHRSYYIRCLIALHSRIPGIYESIALGFCAFKLRGAVIKLEEPLLSFNFLLQWRPSEFLRGDSIISFTQMRVHLELSVKIGQIIFRIRRAIEPSFAAGPMNGHKLVKYL